MDSDGSLLRRLRDGDEQAFVALVERYHSSMLRLALSFVSSQAVAEEVVQDTWLAVLRGLDRFEERSSLRTWLFTILVNRARTTGVREARQRARRRRRAGCGRVPLRTIRRVGGAARALGRRGGKPHRCG